MVLDIYKKRALGALLQHLSDVKGLEWIRLHYAYPYKFPMDALDVMKDRSNICNYLDMPLQHISNPMLSRMRRLITKQDTIDLVAAIRDKVPDIALRTTMLVGFPGETEQDVEELADFVRQSRFERLGIFQYSHEENTYGGQYYEDNVPAEVKAERAAYIMDIQQSISHELNQQKIGKTYKVLFDRKESGQFIGRTEYDSPEVDNEVIVDASRHYVRVGDFANVRISDVSEFDLYGEVVK